MLTVNNTSNKSCDNTPQLRNSCAETELLFYKGSDYFDSLLLGIENAKISIELESYIFRYDSVGRRFVDALVAATGRGVAVRVLIDGIGSAEDGQLITSLLSSQGISSRIYHPLPWQINHYRWAIKQGSLIGRLLFFARTINQRDHRKLCIIDNSALWTGSLNICRQHLSIADGGEGWRDFGVRISDKRVAEARLTFESIWQPKMHLFTKKKFRLIFSNLSPFNRRRKYRFITRKMEHAQHRIWITNAYFAPSSTFINSIKNACRRGVDVHLLVPSRSDVFLFRSLTASYYRELILAGVSIYEFPTTFLHAKALIIDDFYFLGSTNFNHRSFLHDLELDVTLRSKKSQTTLEKQFIADCNKATKITRKQLEKLGWAAYIAWLPRLLRYWL